jgi:uncharacterized protein YndB with AHSA1/START domain
MSVQSEQLRLERSFAARREEVFRAWTEPEVLKRWWAAGPNWQTPLAETDTRVGGRYRLSMQDPESGDTHTVGGEYMEVDFPERLVYTWTWEGADEDSSSAGSIVRVEFHEAGDRTNVVLIHEGITDGNSREQHAHGWAACLDNLESRVFGG